MRTTILFFILIIELSIIGTLSTEAFGDHMRQHEEYVIHPTYPNGFPYTRHELVLAEVWVRPIHIYDLGNEPCAEYYKLTTKGNCKREFVSWQIYPLWLLSEMPPRCNMNALGCVLDTGIYIINGKQGLKPASGGCSILYHEILHIKWFEVYPDPEEAHDFFVIKYPNERCAV